MNANAKSSEFRSFLPAKPGILGLGDYRQSAILVPLVETSRGLELLFELRAKGIAQPGEVCFPGGTIEPGESGLDAALRETEEEIGITRESIEVIGQLDTAVAPMGACVEAYLARLMPGALESIKCNPREVERYFTVPLSWFAENDCETYTARVLVHPDEELADGSRRVLFPAKKLGLSERYQKPWGGSGHKIYIYRTSEGIVWGLTARYVKYLAER